MTRTQTKMLLRRPELTQWLACATKGLCEHAQHLIAEEVTAHVLAAVEEAERHGLPGDDAFARAVSELGNPRTALRAFRKQHLTRREALLIQDKELNTSQSQGEFRFTLVILFFISPLSFFTYPALFVKWPLFLFFWAPFSRGLP